MKNKSLTLLFALGMQLVLYPVIVEAGIRGPVLFATFQSLGPLAAFYFTSDERREFAVTLALGIPLLAATWLRGLGPHPIVSLSNAALALAFYGYVLMITLAFIIRSKRITVETIADAISGYLLIGITWVALFRVLEDWKPGSFSGVNEVYDFIFLSFITLTGVGTGLVSPMSSLARAFTILEAVVGVLYVAIIIALLVGVYSVAVIQNRQKGRGF